MKNRFLRVAGVLSMLWSLVVVGAPVPLSDCAMPSAMPSSAGMHMAMGHHDSMSSHDAGHEPSAPKHHAPGHAGCCSLACCCASFAPLPQQPAPTTARVASVSAPLPVVSQQTIPVRAPHALPFAHAPPLS